MRKALRVSGVSPGQVCHVQVLCTGTLHYERSEAQAAGPVLPQGSTVNAAQAQLSHAIGAAGVIDSVPVAHGAAAGKAIPYHHLVVRDSACPLTPAPAAAVPDWSVEGKRVLLVHSFPFGGRDTAILLVPAMEAPGIRPGRP